MIRLNTPALLSQLAWWDYWTSIALVVVFLGVLLEGIATWREATSRLARSGLVLLVLGLAGEYVTEQCTSGIVAQMNAETARLMIQVYGAAPTMNPSEHVPFITRGLLKRLVLERLDALERAVQETQQRLDALSHK